MILERSLENSIVNYLNARYIYATNDWIRTHLSTMMISNCENINERQMIIDEYGSQLYRKWLDRDWNIIDPDNNDNKCIIQSQYTRPSLPAELDIRNNISIQKKTFTGNYLCQVCFKFKKKIIIIFFKINHIIDISKPLCYELEDQIDNDCFNGGDDFSNDDERDDDDQIGNIIKKAKKNTNKSTSSKPSKSKNNKKIMFTKFGSRMLQFYLYEGQHECVAIEYLSIPVLQLNMIGVKLLLIGPFDAYIGTILLRPENIRIVSDKIFDNQIPNKRKYV